MKIIKKLIAAGVLVAGMLVASPGSAGSTWVTPGSTCHRGTAANDWSYCTGTIRGFRDSSEPGAYVSFSLSSTGSVTFAGAIRSNEYITCWFDTNQYNATFGNALLTQSIDQPFTIWVSPTDGKCTGRLERSSAYASPPGAN
jgi:hypothetical protein